MSDKHLKYLSLLEKVAENVEPIGSSRHSAAIVLKNTVISIGTNRIKTHPFQERFAKNPNAIFLHAETSAISRALRTISLDDLSRSTLYIMRVKRENGPKSNFVWGHSKFCNGCLKCIMEFNIEKVVYTTGPNSYESLNINNTETFDKEYDCSTSRNFY